MKPTLAFLLLLCSLGSLHAQQYHQGAYYDSTILGDYYYDDAILCSQPIVSGSITLDSSLYNYVTGLQFAVVVDSVLDVYNTSFGQMHSGDSIVLSASYPKLTYILNNQASTIRYRVVLSGTPTVINQHYRCALMFDECTCFCPRAMIIAADTTSAMCQVDAGSEVNELGDNNQVAIWPNPATNTVNLGINESMVDGSLTVSDITGRIIMNCKLQFTNYQWATGSLANGIYFATISKGTLCTTRKLIIEK